MDGKEVVQVRTKINSQYIASDFDKVYATDLVSSVATPNQQLVGFQKVTVP